MSNKFPHPRDWDHSEPTRKCASVLVINITWPLHSLYSSSSLLSSGSWPHRGSLFVKDPIKRSFILILPSTAQPLALPSTQTHSQQPDANSYMLLLDVGHSILGTATSSRRYAAIYIFSKSAFLILVVIVPRVNLALEH